MLPPRLDIACVIHGDVYDFVYVEKLYSMLQRHLTGPWRFHVMTEGSRSVPKHMIKHELTEWSGVSGRRSAWWYKLQLFRPENKFAQVLYLDLDTVIVNDLDWILELDPSFFWGLRDFRYIWRPRWCVMNSSLMYFDSDKFSWIWEEFQAQELETLRRHYPGDQDYLTKIIDPSELKFVDTHRAQSWRWQIVDGGIDARTRKSLAPGQGAVIPTDTSVIVCHGSPKPHQITDSAVIMHWR